MYVFLPRATLKGPKRSFVVRVVDGVEASFKNVPKRTKTVQENKKFASVAHYGIECRFCLVWPFVILCGLMWPRMVFLILFMAM